MLGFIVITTGGVPGVDNSQSIPGNPPEPRGSVPPGSVVDGPLRVGEEHYGVKDNLSLFWWNRDRDRQGGTRNITWNGSRPNLSAPSNRTSLNQTQLTALARVQAATRDSAWLFRPPTATWNRRNFQMYGTALEGHNSRLVAEANIPEETKLSTSHHPVPDHKLQDGAHGDLLKDAFASIFSTPEKVRVYDGSSSGRTWSPYVPESGTLLGMVDYRALEPTIREDRSDPLNDLRHTYQLASVGVTNCIQYQPGQDCSGSSSGSGTHIHQLSYNLNGEPNSGQIIYKANITAKYTVTHEEKQDDGSWDYKGTSQMKDYVVVADSVPYRTWNRSDIVLDWNAVRWPNGSLGYNFDFSMNASTDQLPPASWSNITIGPTHVASEWRYTTWRDTQWDEMEVEQNGSDLQYAPIATPVQTNVIPIRQPETNGSRTAPAKILANKSTTNQKLPVPNSDVPRNVNFSFGVGGSSGKFSPTDTLRVILRNDSRIISDSGYRNPNITDIDPRQDLDWDTIIPGASARTNCPQPCVRQVGETKLQAEYHNESNGQVYIKLNLFKRGSSGGWTPIDGPSEVAAPQIWANGLSGWQLASTSIKSDGSAWATIPSSQVRQHVHLRFAQGVSWHSYTGNKRLWAQSSATAYAPFNPRLTSFFIFWIEALVIPLAVLAVIFGWLNRDAVLGYF